MNFSRLYMQSWWEVPSIAYFCSLFRTAFDLLDFDIEELEEALLTDGSEDTASSLLTELIVRLLNGCLGNNDISAFNYQMYLRRLFRRKCQETGRYNPFNTDIDFQFLPLRTKVEILYALCDFRLDAEDVFDLFKNLEAESLRVEPLGWDDNDSAYWYFYGTRLYREDIIRKPKGKTKKKKNKDSRRRGWFFGHEAINDEETERVWQVVCFTEEDWTHLTEKFSKATSKVEKELHRSLSQNFLPEIPRLFQEKERLQRKRLLELPRRTSNRVLQKIKQKEEETKPSTHDVKEDDDRKEDTPDLARENRAKRRNLLRSKSVSSISSKSAKEEMPQKLSKRSKSQDKKSKKTSSPHKGESSEEPPVKAGRKTNNSLASATGQILIPDNDEPISSTRKKLKTSQIFSQSEEDVQTDMYKVLEQLTAHDDAWPFMDPVEEEYAPNYYAVIRRPMDLRKMEKRLDGGYYTDFSMFKADFKLIVNNCRLYNGQDNEYTTMVDNLQTAFDRLTEKYIHKPSSSDEEIAVEFQIPTPSRKHKLKSSESQSHHKKKKRKSHSDTGEPKSSSSDLQDTNQELPDKEVKKSKESHKNKEGKVKKKRKGHHRHGKHSKNHKKNSHKSHGDSSKSKHSKKQKHDKNKDKSGKKSKKKKNKHREMEATEVIKRSASQESIESTSRSRSASPLPSIHTPSPSPTELDQSKPFDQSEQPNRVSDSDFFKDKYDKIKERRRNATKDAWESLFDFKQKGIDKQKHNLTCQEKDKNKNLTETIEKLKAKNEKFKDSSLFNNLFDPTSSNSEKTSDVNKNLANTKDCDDNGDDQKNSPKKGQKKNTAKNESASEALEQAVKDISKWLDDAPKGSTVSSPCDSPTQTISTEDHENSRLDDELSQSEKSIHTRKEISRKRRSSREPKLLKRREIQRTIDRLQPGKSKGNLLTNITNKVEKPEELIAVGPLNKIRESSKGEESSPKLTLGSVLPTVQFTLGSDHNFENNEDTKVDNQKSETKEPDGKETQTEEPTCAEKKIDSVSVQTNKRDAEVETEPTIIAKPSQEKATPNLSAWFKAFGAPKSTPATNNVKKKVEDTDEKPAETVTTDSKRISPKNVTKYEVTHGSDTPNPEGGESPIPNVITTPRQRRTSTGSSMSERSSFSQDLDSPRHQISHTSPLIQSPASPRTEDFQKITYPIINGTVRAGFYQDTTSIKSSPEKSCSPREAPQSPFSPYSQHVYASNNASGSTTPHYFVDQNKSPLPTYTQNPPPYYDTSKAPVASKPRVHVDYTALGPDSYPRNQYMNTFSPGYTALPQMSTLNYSQAQQIPQPPTNIPSTILTNSAPITTESKSTLFPVKKRTYNEPDHVTPIPAKLPDSKELTETTQNKTDYQKHPQPVHLSSLSSTSVDDIALALSEKSDLAKLNNLRDKPTPEYLDRNISENKELDTFDNNEVIQDKNKDSITDLNKAVNSIHKDNIDMVNMGYMNPDDRKTNGEIHDDSNTIPMRDVAKHSLNVQQKAYEIEGTAINLGINTQTFPSKTISKAIINSNNIPPAHLQDRSHNDINLNQIMAHANHKQYDTLSSGQAISNFSINDIEQANKKLYACNVAPSSVAIDFGNWKMTSQIRKQDVMASDYSTSYTSNHSEKTKSDSSNVTANAVNYNKNMHQQQYNSYVPRNNAQRTQDFQQNITSELRIPNPRSLLKVCDHVNLCSSTVNNDLVSKSIDTQAKSQKQEKLVQNHALVRSNPYKAPYSSNHSSLIPQMLERYTNEERYSLAFTGNGSSIYHDKQFQMSQMFNKSMPSEVHVATTPVSVSYSQPTMSLTKDNNTYKSTVSAVQSDTKKTNKRKRSESKSSVIGSQTYHDPSCGSDVLSSVKTSMMPASAFNFGTPANITLGTGLYTDNTGFSIDANQIMAANYMVAAVAHQQRNNNEASAEKIAKPAHQNSSHTTGTFPFIGHSQVPTGYSFVGTETSSPLYQQYLQRHQEELLRQTGAQIMSLYPSGYPPPPSLSVRQPYDSINRPSWL